MFTVFGEGFDDETEVYISGVDSYTIPEYTDAKKILCEKINMDNEGQSITCRMPKSADNLVYNLWAVNKYGESAAVPLNGARPQWASVDKIAPNMEFKIVGRNMSAASFGGRTSTYAALYDGIKHYFLNVVDVNEFAITVKCPEGIPVGNYDIYVTNNSKTWFKIEDKRQIYVSGNVYDPISLGVQWAEKFNWDKKINVSPVANGDSTERIQEAIDRLYAAGGGMVTLSAGTFNIKELTLKKGVVLSGSGKETTILNDIGTAEYLIHLSADGIQGICNLQITSEVQNKGAAIECYEGRWSSGNVSGRTGEYYFLKNIKGRLSDVNEGKAYPFMAFCCKSHILVDGCDISGYEANIKSTYVNEYAYLTNNKFSTVLGNTILVAAYADIENNYIERRALEDLDDDEYYTQGIFTRGASYVSGNIIKNVGSKDFNDGEIICTEDNGESKLSGLVSKVDGNVISLNVFDENYADWNIEKITWGEPYIVISAGRGLGQYRKIVAYDPVNKTVTVDRPFLITPNDKSQFTIAAFNVNVTMYNNYAENTAKGYWLYGYTLDGVICNNIGINTEGAFLVTKFNIDNNKEYENLGYFVRMNNNKFEGNSTRTGKCGIGAWNKILSDIPDNRQCLGIYGLEICDNQLVPNSDANVKGEDSEAYRNNGIYLVLSDNTVLNNNPTSKAKAVIIENNLVKNSDRGITIEGFANMSDNINIGSNNFENVDNKVLDSRSDKNMYILNTLNFDADETVTGTPCVATVNGKKMMYLGTTNGLYVFNIDDVKNPTEIQYIETISVKSILEESGYLYIGADKSLRKYKLNEDGSIEENGLQQCNIPEFDYTMDMKVVDSKYLFISHKGDKEAVSIFDITSDSPEKVGAISARSPRAISRAGISVLKFDVMRIGEKQYRFFAVNRSSYLGIEFVIKTVDLSSDNVKITDNSSDYVAGSGIEGNIGNPDVKLIDENHVFIAYSDSQNKNYTGDVIDISSINTPIMQQKLLNDRCNGLYIDKEIYVPSPDGKLSVYEYQNNVLLLKQVLCTGEGLYAVNIQDDVITAFARNKVLFINNLR